MGNPFYNQNTPPQSSNPMMKMIQQFQQFSSNFQGDPRQRVQELLNSGQMSQQQFNYLSNLANQFQKGRIWRKCRYDALHDE